MCLRCIHCLEQELRSSRGLPWNGHDIQERIDMWEKTFHFKDCLKIRNQSHLNANMLCGKFSKTLPTPCQLFELRLWD